MTLTDADVEALRAQFPVFGRRVNGRPLVYLDSASTTQKPAAVIGAVQGALEGAANIHRGVHALSVENTEAFEAVRGKAAELIGGAAREIVFTRGTTEAINLVAQAYGRAHVGPGDEVLVTELEHHSNLVPWQLLCREKGAHLRVLPIDDRGDVDLGALDAHLDRQRTKIVALAHVSNTLGAVLPVAEIARRARAAGAVTVVDGAQAVAHRPVDVAALGCDFYAFSGHKVYGPTGAGVLWGRHALLEAMPPWQGGGDMILSVSFAETTFAEVPHRFEAGTPDIVGVIGMGAAIDWLRALGVARVAAREREILAHALERLAGVEGVTLVGTPSERCGAISFNLGAVHPHDVGTALDLEGVAVRTGHHCTQPLMERLGVDGTVRASLGVYNTRDDVDRLVTALEKARGLFR